MAAGDWCNAIRVAARLPRLDRHRCAILDAQGAYENPGFYAQIGKDAGTLIEAGAAALCERFGHNQESKTMEQKTYSKASNARRGAIAAGHKEGEFSVYKIADGKFGFRATKPAKAAKPRQFVDESARDKRRIDRIVANARPSGKRADVMAAAQAGKLPPPPDFSAPTHARYRAAAEDLVALAKAGDIEGVKATEIKAYSSSPKAMAKYRDLAVIALEARRAAEPEATAA